MKDKKVSPEWAASGTAPGELIFEAKLPEPEEVANLYRAVGWHVLPVHAYRRALAGTFISVSARSGGRLVGFGRAVSDGAIYAWIHDVIVDPERQGEGIGRKILKQLLDRVVASGVPYIGLFAAKGRDSFYETFGFKRRPTDAPGMFLYLMPD